MQADLDALVEWSETWHMPFNEDKCKVMHVGSANQELVFHMRDFQLESSEVERNLGIHIDSLLKFRQQAAAAIAKATQVLAVIWHSFVLTDELTLSLLFKSPVCPHLENGNLIWGPFKIEDQQAVERAQR